MSDSTGRAARTEYIIGDTRYTGTACTNCGTAYDTCTRHILTSRARSRRACCRECAHKGTHDEQPATVTPPAPHGTSVLTSLWDVSARRVIEERDRARRTAVDLENRLVAAESAIERIRALHHKYGLYEECGDGHIRDVCAECCTEDCADNHGGPCWPCPTLTAIEEGPTDD